MEKATALQLELIGAGKNETLCILDDDPPRQRQEIRREAKGIYQVSRCVFGLGLLALVVIGFLSRDIAGNFGTVLGIGSFVAGVIIALASLFFAIWLQLSALEISRIAGDLGRRE